ncbi:DNA repair protein RecN [Luteitalea sp. TBR-22]|uniref:DNA repair protein RecN n=1 Tax=Luteitalea sp. TBR-22 TaxID=2802971 RepID=UPI001AF112DD|nr:DNA repair protein RecN [Luteitalea sp. TBR-22]BCS33375.1 DNA repair protein RecN [Luteitalea sp. TBR-22]
MIRFLSIRHLAVIEALDLSLGDGLTVLTGETGAGKSVLVEGIGLLLGGRASADMVRTGAAVASVQAIIATPGGAEVIVRREVSAEGRSRAFIDDVLVTAGTMRERVSGWVDLHGQHEHQTLQLPETHLDLLDRVAGLAEPRAAVARAHGAWVAARDALAATQMDARERSARIDLLSFQLSEIDRVQPLDDEDEQLAATRLVLSNADRLQRLGREAYEALYEGEHSALQSLAVVWKRVDELAHLDPAAQAYASQRDGLKAQLDDLAFFLRQYVSGIDASPERLQEVEDRLAALERLKRKYGPSLADVRTRQRTLGEQLAALQQPEGQLSALQAAADEAAATYLSQARELSAARQTAAGPFTAHLRRELADLAMPHADVSFRFQAATGEGEWLVTGIDRAELLLSANPGEAPRPLARVASGGELSRVMLAVKVLDAPEATERTLIFDEVDAGIGGRVADAVGARLRALSGRAQVLCVTHLPQVAAYADAHIHIAKQVVAGRTQTTATHLHGDARVEEIARMMAGDTSAPMLEGARTLLHAKTVEAKVLPGRKAKGESEAAAKGESETAAASRRGRGRGA